MSSVQQSHRTRKRKTKIKVKVYQITNHCDKKTFCFAYISEHNDWHFIVIAVSVILEPPRECALYRFDLLNLYKKTTTTATTKKRKHFHVTGLSMPL